MRIKTLVAVATTTAAAVALAIGGAYAARADTISTRDEAYIRSQATTLGVDKDTQDKLIAKYAAGQLIDADNPKAKPVSEETALVDGYLTTTRRYADGSVGVGKVEQADAVHTDAISGCQVAWRKNDQVFWTGCKVSWDGLTWSMHYYANYGIYQFGSWIDSVSGLTWGGAGSFSDGHTEIPVKEGHGRSNPAIAQGKVTQCGGPVGCRTVGVEVKVRADWGGGRSSSFGD